MVGTEGLQEKARRAKEKLDGHCQTRSERHKHYFGWIDRTEWRQRLAPCIHQDAG